MNALGIDIGGTGIKAAVVDTATGAFITERWRVATPEHPGREALSSAIAEMAHHFSWNGPVGCGFPGVMRRGVIQTAVNLSPELVGWDLSAHLGEVFQAPCPVINDADVAALAEMRLGAGVGVRGTVLVLTVGTGIGTAVFHEGHLVPNLELGHLILHGEDAETLISTPARKRAGLTWMEWTGRFNDYLAYICGLLQPERIILGGGGAKKPEKFLPYLKSPVPVELAAFGNRAGIIGAAISGSEASIKLRPLTA
jgi:polyphosphate glucokinase